MTRSAQRIAIRRARPSDKKVVLGFCRRTWGEWGDYIDKVWDEWVKDKRGFFAVASLGERPIGTAKLTVLNKREMWFEGLRVDPSLRGMGISHLLTAFLAREALKRCAETVRYATGARNRASLHIGKSWGLRRVGRYSILSANSDGRRGEVFERMSDPTVIIGIMKNLSVPVNRIRMEPIGRETRFSRASLESVLMGAARMADKGSRGRRNARLAEATDEIARVVNSAPFTKAMFGLASEGWTFFRVDRDFLDDSFGKQEFFLGTLPKESAVRWQKNSVMRGPERGAGLLPGKTVAGWHLDSRTVSLLGILIASPQRNRRRLLVKLVAEFRKDALGPLLSGTRRLAYELGLPRVRLIVPATRAILACAGEAGFKEEDKGFYHVVMEMHLRDRRTRARVARLVAQYL